MNTEDELELAAQKIEEIAKLWSGFAEAYILHDENKADETIKDL